jgi:hypothetical protein
VCGGYNTGLLVELVKAWAGLWEAPLSV